MSQANIIAMNVLCADGRGAEQVWAALRAGIGKIADAGIVDVNRDPICMGLVPVDAIMPLPPELDALPLPPRARRMLGLGAPTLAGVLEAAGNQPLRLYLALPNLSAKENPWLTSFAIHLAAMAGVTLDHANSRVLCAGRAAGIAVLEHALRALQADPSVPVVVGGIDSFLDLSLLAQLEAEGRILGPRIMDGFIPGEGAAFYVLSAGDAAAPVPNGRPVHVQGAASVRDPGHRYGTEPARGEGLAIALEALRARAAPSAPIGTVFSGINGESFDAKLWGVAQLRHRDLFAPNLITEMPADCIGDTGAAAGAILTVIAATALSRRHRPGPALVWAASDHEPRACALLGST